MCKLCVTNVLFRWIFLICISSKSMRQCFYLYFCRLIFYDASPRTTLCHNLIFFLRPLRCIPLYDFVAFRWEVQHTQYALVSWECSWDRLIKMAFCGNANYEFKLAWCIFWLDRTIISFHLFELLLESFHWLKCITLKIRFLICVSLF